MVVGHTIYSHFNYIVSAAWISNERFIAVYSPIKDEITKAISRILLFYKVLKFECAADDLDALVHV